MQLKENKYFRDILEEEKKSEFVIANELQNPDRQKAFTFSFEDISLDITRQLISSNQLTKLKMLGKVVDIEDKKKELFEGSFVNVTENRLVTHFLERNPNLVSDKAKRYKSFISFKFTFLGRMPPCSGLPQASSWCAPHREHRTW